jgi:hypothetical protein
MTISRKLNKSITTALITLLMLSTFVGVISLANAAVVASPSNIAFSASGAGTSLWSNVDSDAGDYSANLVTSGTDTAEVKIPTNLLFGQPDQDLSDPAVLSFMGNVVASGGTLTTRLYMDSNNDGATDYYFSGTLTAVANWVQYAIGTGDWTVTNTTKNADNSLGTLVHGIAVGTSNAYTGWNATVGFAEDKVVSVSVRATGTINIFVDSMAIGSNTYNLEPVAMTFSPVLAKTQSSAPSAPPGSTVNIMAATGSFNTAVDNPEQVVSFFQGVGPAIDTTDSSNAGSVLGDFVVPNLPAGTYTITSIGLESGKSFTGQFTISSPSIDFSKSKASAGSEITVTGTNFRAGATGVINITFNGAPWNSVLLDTDAAGAFTSGTLVVPTLPPGAYIVSATDGLNTATKTFTIPVVAITKVDPSSGPTGSAVTLTGEGFTRNGLVQIFLDGVLFKSGVADAFGALPSPVRDLVINKAPGTVTIQALDVTSGLTTAPATFTVKTPSISGGLTIPSTSTNTAITNGPVGATVWVNGTNFKVGASVNITLGIGGPQICASPLPVASSTGKLSTTLCTISDVAPGDYVIAATDGINTATTAFTVNAPAITLTPAAGPVGTNFLVKGTNFKASAVVDITWINGTTNTIALTSTTANENGTISIAQVVPAGPIGAYTVNATDNVNFAEATFDIGAAIMVVDPNQGPPGTLVNVQGKGFTISGEVNVYLDETLMATVTANSTGGINLNVTIPDLAKGNHAFTAYDVATDLTTPAMTYKVSTPTLALDQTELQVGQLVLAQGTLYKLNAEVNIYFDSILVATLQADEDGTLPSNANFTVPSVVPGAYVVSATDGVNTATAAFNVFGSGGIDTIINMLSQYGSFWNFTNDWFMTINNKLGNFTGDDTVASLLYSIQSQVNLPSELVFDFGGVTAYNPANIHITTATVYDSEVGYGWLDTTGLQTRDRTGVNDALRAFIFANTDKTFQVDLPDGEYLVTVVQGDQLFPHDGMTITANGELVSTTSSAIGQFPQKTFTVEVEDGYLQLTFGQSGATNNWVVNGVTIRQALP